MSKAPSFEELKDSDWFNISLSPKSFIFNENVQIGLDNIGIATGSSVYFQCEVDDISEVQNIDIGSSIRVELRERELDCSRKYPMGLINFWEDSSVSITLFCRDSLITKLCALHEKTSEILVSIPMLPSDKPSVFPVLNYQIRAEINH